MSESWTVGDMEVSTPFGNAAGVVKRLEEAEAMVKAPIGVLTAGSYTLEQRYGNACDAQGDPIIDEATGRQVRDYHFDEVSGVAVNSIGLEGPGMDVAERDIIPQMAELAHKHGKKLKVSVAPVTTEPVQETLELVQRAHRAGADKVEINFSCPNVKDIDGGPHKVLCAEPAQLFKVTRALVPLALRLNTTFVAKVSPTRSYDKQSIVLNQLIASRPINGEREHTLETIKRSGIFSAVVISNTFGLTPEELAFSPLGVPGGGKSGPGLGPMFEKELDYAVSILAGSGIDVIACGGIWAGEDLANRLVRKGRRYAAMGEAATFFMQSENNWAQSTAELIESSQTALGKLL